MNNGGGGETPPPPMPPTDMGGGMPPMGAPNEEQMPPMPQDDMMGGGAPPMEEPNQFDTNFDAGVEADEEQDPRKYIQQLTGKLSQSLRSYNENNGQIDTDLNKYVAGMIVKQTTEELSPEDTEEILNKIKSGEEPNLEGGEEMNGNGQPPMGPPMGGGNEEQMPPMPNEAVKRIRNIVENALRFYDEEKREREERPKELRKQNLNRFSVMPYTSPKFEG